MTAQLTPNAVTTLRARYLRKDDTGAAVETPEEMFRRVARAVARAEARYGGESAASEAETRFYELMASLAFLPNSPTLMNAGTELGQLAACFVLPVEDSLTSIFNTPETRRSSIRAAGDRVLVLRACGRPRPGEEHDGRLIGPGFVHEDLRRGHRRDQAGGNAPGCEHGGPPRRPPGCPRVRRLQRQRRGARQLQHLGGRTDRFMDAVRSGERSR